MRAIFDFGIARFKYQMGFRIMRVYFTDGESIRMINAFGRWQIMKGY